MTSPFRQDRIAGARMMVVGCGALGNEVLKNLALMGAEHLTVVDFDRVEVGNLSRSVLFSKEDAEAGRYKVDAVCARLKQMNAAMEIDAIRGDIAYDVGLGLVRKMDVVIGCVDNRWARYCINRLCMRAGVPWVDGGIDALEGTVRVFAPGENCYACNLGPEGLKDMTRRMPCSGVIRRNEQAGRAPTNSLIASVIGAVQVQEALKLLHKEELAQGSLASLCGRMFYYEGGQLSTKLVAFKAWDDDCPVHERWEPVRKSAVCVEMTVGEALACLRKELQAEQVCIHLTGDCFVDYLVRRDNDARRELMRPGRAVEDCLAQDPDWRGLPLSGLYQHEYREIDGTFPYPGLTLSRLGVPAREVLYVTAGVDDYYLEIG